MDPRIDFASVDYEPVEKAREAVSRAGVNCEIIDNDPDHRRGQAVHLQRYSLVIHDLRKKEIEAVLREFDHDFARAYIRTKGVSGTTCKFDVCVDLLRMVMDGSVDADSIAITLDKLLMSYSKATSNTVR